MADFVLRECNPTLEVSGNFIDIVCLAQLASVPRSPIKGGLQLVAVQLDGTVAVAFLACPLDEVRIEDIGNLRWHQRTGELFFQLDDAPQNMVVVETMD